MLSSSSVLFVLMKKTAQNNGRAKQLGRALVGVRDARGSHCVGPSPQKINLFNIKVGT